MNSWGFFFMANKIIERFEVHVGHRAQEACLLIGMAYPTYAAYRNGSRALPIYHHNHIKDIMRLPSRELRALIAERIGE
jgi:hypothetical protein